MTATALTALIDQLAAAPFELRRGCEALSAAPLRERPAPQEFSPLETAWHLCDIEAEGYLVRIGLILSAEAPTLPSLDGERLAIERNYQGLELAGALDGFSAARRASVELLSRARPEQFSRTASFEGQTLTLARLIEMMVEHDSGHLSSIDRRRASSQAA